MCGIAGAVSWNPDGERRLVEKLACGIRHRGPDDAGMWSSKDGIAVFGHARLSIIDLSPLGHQPMIDPLTGNAIVFNGEIYNFLKLREECEKAGEKFHSDSDTEVILAMYRLFGVQCLGRLRGMFAFAIWDAADQKLFLARDRLGKKPLNYAVNLGRIVFCSELWPLSRSEKIDGTVDIEALHLYLQCQYIPAPWTIYHGIRKLPPGHYAIFDRSGLRLEKYWEVDYRQKASLSEADALDAFEEKLTEAVRLRMIADVPLGALLSGGVDSSVVVALMAKLSSQPVRTFSIGFNEAAFNEVPFANQAAERCGTVHHAEIVTAEVEQMLPRIARHYGEPFADSSAIPSFLVSAVARQHVTVALNGDGGDELLGGYPRYWLGSVALATSAVLGKALRPSTLARLAPRLMRVESIPGRAARKVLMAYANPELRALGMYAEFWDDETRASLVANGADAVLPRWRSESVAGAFANANTVIDRMLWLDSHTYLPGDLLVKMDIASMHCGLETRSPLLDHEVVEFAARLPDRYKVRNGVGKYLLKKLAERYFPSAFVHRRKMGFGIPLADWLRGPLRNVLWSTLTDACLMRPLSQEVIQRTLTEFEQQAAAHESRLWALLMYGQWAALRA